MVLLFAYFSLTFFILGIALRGKKLSNMPIHLRWELAPVPHEKGKASYGGSYFEEYEWWTKKREKSLIAEMWYMFQEIIFLKGVYENNRKLWFVSFPFHFGGIYLLTAMAGLSMLSALLGLADITLPVAVTAIKIVGVCGYVLGTFGVAGLLLRRMVDEEISMYTTFAAIFNLLFLGVVFVTGLMAVFSVDNFGAVMAGFMKSLLTADSSIVLPAILKAHIILAGLFLVYLPFTYMMHFVAKYFTYHEIRWNDEPMMGNSKMEKEVTELLGQKITWSADHIKGEGKKTWVDAATEEIK